VGLRDGWKKLWLLQAFLVDAGESIRREVQMLLVLYFQELTLLLSFLLDFT